MADAANQATTQSPVREAANKACDATMNAEEGDFGTALSGSIDVINATFANLRKEHQEKIASLTKQGQQQIAKEEQLGKKQVEVEAMGKDAASRGQLFVIITQAGYTTQVYIIVKTQPLAETLRLYAVGTGQETAAFVVFRAYSRSSKVQVDPATVMLEPERVYEVVKVTAAKRKALPAAADQAGKKQKV
ncbi:hypothetical protein LTR36_009713 [Oleoguttula mirabilis]|uniref:Uncharacterized protein n=1 Tax=Oleoguttula mirabilis TaxID=1507867 RepID=A0AAV9J6C7_9PEZI|nr:hypothetical protein LTR36_009713 [Oleoguttula mirabilis]